MGVTLQHEYPFPGTSRWSFPLPSLKITARNLPSREQFLPHSLTCGLWNVKAWVWKNWIPTGGLQNVLPKMLRQRCSFLPGGLETWLLSASRMPGVFKRTLYALISTSSFASFILILVALGTPKWMTGKILCKTGAELVNATDPELVKFIGEIYYGLFGGGKMRKCGLGGRRSKFTSK